MTTLATPAHHPLLLPPELRLSPEQFALVCQANPDAVLELSASTATDRHDANRW